MFLESCMYESIIILLCNIRNKETRVNMYMMVNWKIIKQLHGTNITKNKFNSWTAQSSLLSNDHDQKNKREKKKIWRMVIKKTKKNFLLKLVKYIWIFSMVYVRIFAKVLHLILKLRFFKRGPFMNLKAEMMMRIINNFLSHRD